MFRKAPARGLIRAALVLGSAGVVAHVVFFSLFVFRVVSHGGFGRLAHGVLALLAALGVAASFVGRLLVKYGGPTRARSVGVALVATSTALAALLLVAAAALD